jgi:hypothetical protein
MKLPRLTQVQTFHTTRDYICPEVINTSAKSFTLLPRETILIVLKRKYPNKPYRYSRDILICYLVKNTTTNGLKCTRKTSLTNILRYSGIQHNLILLSTMNVLRLLKKWKKGQCWYKLRKHFLMTNRQYKFI